MITCPRCGYELDLVLVEPDFVRAITIRDSWCPQCKGTLTEIYDGDYVVAHWVA